MHQVVACDLGASSGRIFLQDFTGEKIELHEIHRFSNGPIREGGHFYWDFEGIIHEIKETILQLSPTVQSLGIDTWGVDFGLLNEKGTLLSKPFSYRDEHTLNQLEKVTQPFEFFQQTGNEISSINTIFQLMAIQEKYPELLRETSDILMMPNLLMHRLSGEKINEFSISSTSGLLNTRTQEWDQQIQQTFFGKQLPLANVQLPHQLIGQYKGLKLALVPGHDTACALSALPLKDEHSVFMSLGTWGVIGQEVKQPIISEAAFLGGFTNEGASEGNYRFQKNAMGFWIIQQVRKQWNAQGINLTHEEEKYEMEKHNDFSSIIDPEHSSFFNPENMIEAIKSYCHSTKQQPPTEIGQILVLFIRSLAVSYHAIINRMSALTGHEVKEIIIGGGGANHHLLCQSIANSTGIPVHTGPVEASSIGNGLSQLRALGEISTLQDGRRLVKNSFNLTEFEPQNQQFWNEMNEKYRLITGGIIK